MRAIILISVLILGLGGVGKKNAARQSGTINGVWLPVKQELGGAALSKTAFEKEKLIISDSTYTVIAESVDKGLLKYSNGKMDIYGKQGVNAGKHYTAIYKYENKQLTICYNLKGDSYPEAFDTKGKPLFLLSVFIKEEK
jgi:uncharacterized protein (TIGR03067 family)